MATCIITANTLYNRPDTTVISIELASVKLAFNLSMNTICIIANAPHICPDTIE